MPCPAAAPIAGSSFVTRAGYQSRAAAEGAARAAIHEAAWREAFREIAASGFCPKDCPYPAPRALSYTPTKVDSSWTWFVNIFFGSIGRLFGNDWYYEGIAYFNWTATAACAREPVTYRAP